MNSGEKQLLLYLSRTAHKSQKKLDKPLRRQVKDALLSIANDPLKAGKQLSTPLSGIYSHHITYQGKEFRIAYQIDVERECIWILMIGAHENFYRRLKNLLYAS
ncbi:MAG: type II toxin-antitoxin system RelE/ParE family toxin [Vampirovibrio sp.]|nr:type II toxin-antitoxin system RelE/ParE family toxin [Vampirovibrio sp.]